MKSGHGKGTGRPRKPRELVKTEVVKFRVSPGEHDQVQRMADHRGMSMSDMIRDCLFKDGEHANSTR